MQMANSVATKFSDPAQAGLDLAQALHRYHAAEQTLVLAIVRGGVPVALQVARSLALPMDLVVLRALFQGPQATVVRIARVAGSLADRELVEHGMPPAGCVEATFVDDAMRALAQRENDCRGPRAPRPIAGHTVILVDNGMRTGGTMLTAIGAARDLGATRVVVATPVSAVATHARIKHLADETICLRCPDPFIHVGLWYQRFEVPSEREIADQLQSFDNATPIVDSGARSMPA